LLIRSFKMELQIRPGRLPAAGGITRPRRGRASLESGFQGHDAHAFGTGLFAWRLSRMQTSDQYLKFAEECDRLAQQAAMEHQREILKEMAETWRKLVAEADGKSAGKSR
jgi:hypothetical protein